MVFLKADLVLNEVFNLVEMFISIFSFREREAAERKKKEDENRRNTEERSNEKQVIYVRHADT